MGSAAVEGVAVQHIKDPQHFTNIGTCRKYNIIYNNNIIIIMQSKLIS